MKRLLLILPVLGLAACAGTPQVRATNALSIACDAYATALDQLTPLRRDGKLSATVVGRVDAATKLVKPVCSSGSIVDPATAVTIVQSGIALLNAAKGQ